MKSVRRLPPIRCVYEGDETVTNLISLKMPDETKWKIIIEPLIPGMMLGTECSSYTNIKTKYFGIILTRLLFTEKKKKK